MMEITYVALAALAMFFLIVLVVLLRKESKALRRDESASDPMFRSARTVTKKRSF